MNGKQLFFWHRLKKYTNWEKWYKKLGPKDGVKIKVYMASGLCKRTFHRGDSFHVSVRDWLARKYSFMKYYVHDGSDILLF